MNYSDFLQSPSSVPGWPVKACVGLFCILVLVLSPSLGFLAFILLLYIGVILRVSVQPAVDTATTIMPDDVIVAPVDGRVLSVDRHGDGRYAIALQPDLFDSHLHYPPVQGQIDDIIWIDGSFKFNALEAVPNDARARREISWKTPTGRQVELTQFGSRYCRLIQCFLREGRQVAPSDPAGLALFRGVVMVSFTSASDVLVVPGQRCLAAQTPLGRAD